MHKLRSRALFEADSKNQILVDNMAIYVLDISVFQFSKIAAIVVSRSPGDTVTLESLESQCGVVWY